MKEKRYLCFASAGADTELKLIIVEKKKDGPKAGAWSSICYILQHAI